MRVLMEYFVHPILDQSPVRFDLKKVIWVEPFLGISKEQLVDMLSENNMEKEPVILFLSSVDPDLLQGVIFPDKGLGVFDFDLKPLINQLNSENYKRKLRPEHSLVSVESMSQALERMIKKAQNKIEEGRAYSVKLRHYFEGQIKTNPFEQVKEKVLKGAEQKKEERGKDPLYSLESYYGAFTSKGPRYFTYPLQDAIKKWIILKGHAEKEISKLFSEIKSWAESEGIPLKVDRCPLHTGEIDRLLLPTLNVGLIDGNSYHPFEPVYPEDDVIDLDELISFQDTFYYFAPEIKELQAFYKQKMRQATLHLQEAANDLWAFIKLYEPINFEEILEL